VLFDQFTTQGEPRDNSPKERRQDKLRGLDLAADDYLTRPLNMDGLKVSCPASAPPLHKARVQRRSGIGVLRSIQAFVTPADACLHSERVTHL